MYATNFRYNFSCIAVAILMCATNALLTSCKDDSPEPDRIFSVDEVDTENGDFIRISATQAGKGYHKNMDGLVVSSSYAYTIRTSSHWRILPKDEDSSWVHFLSMEGDGDSRLFFGIWPNETFEKREANFTLVLDGREQPRTFIHIEQEPLVPTFSVTGGNLLTIPDTGGEATIAVVTNTGNVEFNIEYADNDDGDWLKYKKDASKGTNLVFSAEANSGENERIAYVIVSSAMFPDMKTKVTVVQNTSALLIFDDFSYLNFTSNMNIWNGTGERPIEQWSSDALSKGWTGLFNGIQTASRVYGRMGYVLLGNGGRIGTLASPAFSGIGEDTADVEITFDCVGYVSESGTRDYSDLYIGVWGAGEIEGATEDLTVNYKQLGGSTTLKMKHIEITNFPNRPAGIFPEGYDEWDSANARVTLRVKGADSGTRIILIGGYWENARTKNSFDSPDPVQNGVTYRRNNRNNRLGIDNFKAIKVLK